MGIRMDSGGVGYELDCGCFVSIELESMAITSRSRGPLVDRWPYSLLIDCPYCGDSYCWARPLSDTSDE